MSGTQTLAGIEAGAYRTNALPARSKYPPYSGDDANGPNCPKCGFASASTKYIPAHNFPGFETEECLYRECRRCEYGWSEATIDT